MRKNDTYIRFRQQLDRRTGYLFSGLWIMTVLFFIQEPLIRNSTLGVIIWVPSVAAILLLGLTIYFRASAYDVLIGFLVIAQLAVVFAYNKAWRNTALIFPLMKYAAMVFSLLLCSRVTIRKRTFDIIFFAALICAVLLIVYSFTPIATRYDSSRYAEYDFVPDFYVFNFNNPNVAAFYILGIFCVLLINLPFRKLWPVILALLLGLLWLIYKTGCRTSLVAALAVALIFLFFSHGKIPNWVSVLIIILPLFFVIFYMGLYSFYGEDGVIFLGKLLFSGREFVFQSYLDAIESPFQVIFGNYTKVLLNNAHNAPLTIYASFGIYGLACYYGVVFPCFFRVSTVLKSRITTASVACILGFFVMSCSEAIPFLGTFPGIVFLDTFFLLANFSEPIPVVANPIVKATEKLTARSLRKAPSKPVAGE